MHGPGHGPSDAVHLVRQLPREPRGGAQHHLQGGQQRRLVYHVGSVHRGGSSLVSSVDIVSSSDIPHFTEELWTHNFRNGGSFDLYDRAFCGGFGRKHLL